MTQQLGNVNETRQTISSKQTVYSTCIIISVVCLFELDLNLLVLL